MHPQPFAKFGLTSIFLLLSCLLLASCASYLHTPLHEQQSFTMRPLTTAAEKFYDYPRRTLLIRNHTDKNDVDLAYTIHHLEYPSIGQNQQDNDLVRATYYKNKSTKKLPLVIVLPLWGSYTYPADEITHDLIHSDSTRHVIQIIGERYMLDWVTAEKADSPQAFLSAAKNMATSFKTHITDIRRLIDWAEKQASIDSRRIAVIGFSHSALVAVVTAAVEPRIHTVISVMGGTNIPHILTYCPLPRADGLREAITQRFGWSKQRYLQALKQGLYPLNMATLQQRINPANALIIESHFDKCMQQQSRNDLWKYMGYPERFSYEYGHKMSFLSMTFLGGWSMRDKIYRFLDDRL